MKSPGVEFVAMGKIATKEDLEVHYNSDKQVLLMASNNQKK
jgi:hypothetical protein